MARQNVPKFGNWEEEDNVPYTVYFEKARKNRGGNPSDTSPVKPASLPRARSDELFRTEAAKSMLEEGKSKDDHNLSQMTKSPRRGEHYIGTGQKVARLAGPSTGSEQNVDGKNYDNSQGHHGRYRVRPPAARGDDSPDEGVTVPPFGEWDESDPQAAENYSRIFDMVREERNNGNVSGTPNHPRRGQQIHGTKKCCFPCW